MADLRGAGTRFATIDYSEDVPHIYVGERLPFDTFGFAGLRDPDRPVEPGARAIAFKCAGCGAPIEKHVAASEVVACTSCGSVTDVTGTVGEIVQRNERQDRLAEPTFPLGTTGTWQGAKYEVVGALRRAIVVEGETYEWSEYLLHNATAGLPLDQRVPGALQRRQVDGGAPEGGGRRRPGRGQAAWRSTSAAASSISSARRRRSPGSPASSTGA